MSKQLGINPAMDKFALDNGLGHWSCTDPINAMSWLRLDGKCMFFNTSDHLGMFSLPIFVYDTCFNGMRIYDRNEALGKDWQQPEKYNIGVIRKSYGFTIDINGQILGLVAGDMGYEDTGMFVDDACKEAINAITGDK